MDKCTFTSSSFEQMKKKISEICVNEGGLNIV